MTTHFKTIAAALNIAEKQVVATLALLKEGGTVPFIARYRKEATGSLDEVIIAQIRDRAQQLEELDKRREAIVKSLTELGFLTDELTTALNAAENIATLEDIYLPYKPKRRTRASVARDKGLEPLAGLIFNQGKSDPETEAARFIDEKKGVFTVEDALNGARDILAEVISENAEARDKMRKYFSAKAVYKSTVVKGKEAAGIKYRDYFEWEEGVKAAPSHRVLAMRRGEEEGFLKLSVLPGDEGAIELLESTFINSSNACSAEVKLAIADGYKRLLKPAMENELRQFTKQKADEAAIKVFAENARQLLLSAPLGQKNVLAIDPGFRTGCKVVSLDKQGKLLETATIYPHSGEGGRKGAAATIEDFCRKYAIEAIAIGNGTAGRETESFVKSLGLTGVDIVMVNESGASIYSASEVAREEFPDQDITIRGAVSIGRRLMDPLAELVKIDPKSIGVGQYQHDVDQTQLQQSLDDTVVSCVNAVGVELNTASKQILAYISGLGPALAQQIVNYRDAHGAFEGREQLKKVPRLGDKAFEQAAGFLRIRNGKHPLDASGVHPERYSLVEQICKDLGTNVADLMADKQRLKQINLQRYVTAEIGLPTLNDIVAELGKPGRDPREQFESFHFAEGINAITDLKVGMKLTGRITNITNFGAFADIGVHQDGLIHTSQLANKFVANPNEIVKVNQVVEVTVLEVDAVRKRISLTMKTAQRAETPKPGAKAVAKPATRPMKTQHQQKKVDKPQPEGDLQTKLLELQQLFKK